MADAPNKSQGLSAAARFYVAVIATFGLSFLVSALLAWESPDLLKYGCYLAVALIASGLKISFPTMAGTLSVNFLFILFAIVELTLPETMLLGALTTLIQCLWYNKRSPRPVQVLFNVTCVANAIAVTDAVYHSQYLKQLHLDPAITLVLTTLVFFVMNTFPVAAILALTEQKKLGQTWKECYFWSLPYYLIGAAIAQVSSLANRYVGWQTALLVIPVVYLIYRSYCLYLARLEDEKKHAEEVSSLHLRTIEALALAIEAKDHTTHDHLQRVQVYAIELAKELSLSHGDMEALRAASLLHDIGKLAVPEHIISKPGKLTPEEFEKMKIHPIVGAEILDRVQFPYPVVPIVLSHHEKWDGSGYPYGLKGESIPIGARILSVVDALDALASDRQYRRALPLPEAMKVVKDQAGKSFDPSIVSILEKKYMEFEQKARQVQIDREKLDTNIQVEAGVPAAGFEQVGASQNPDGSIDFLTSIAAARQEVQTLFELAQDLGNSLSLNDTLSVLAARLRKMVPYHSLAFYLKRDGKLIPDYVTGEDFRLFSSLEIPIGQGLSGWVAEAKKPIVNGNPSVEPGYLNDATKFSTLRSAMAVPLEGVNGVVGVVTLYHADKDAFTKDHLRILLAISSKVALSIENALKYRQAENSATTDYLTGLPNARSLFLQLDSELARCRRSNTPIAVLVCDLNGFKAVNDKFGHLEGNRLLKAVAKGLKDVCREYDSVARMGGDEFVLILPGLKQEDVEAKVEKLREVVAAASRSVLPETVVSLSAGLAHFPEDGKDAEALLAEADRRMYKEKQSGKLLAAAAGTGPEPRPTETWPVRLMTTRIQ
jgi:diguanylate cyclase (GGDEF)-like protein/putative nucleotidyltransferase with HDIG domain